MNYKEWMPILSNYCTRVTTPILSVMGSISKSLFSVTFFKHSITSNISILKVLLILSVVSIPVVNHAFAKIPHSSAFFSTEAIVVVSNLNSSGAGSLSQTIFDASAGDTVTFDPSLDNGTITGLGITISKDITIDASDLSNGITLEGFGGGSVFTINGGTVSFIGLTIANPLINDSFTIGGLANFATTIIENCHFNNIGTGDGPTLTAGVYNEDGASLTLTNTSFSNITGASGIRNEGSLVMRNVTLNNVNTDDGGGGLDVVLNTATGIVSADHITIYNNIGVAIRNLAPSADFNINYSIIDECNDLGGEALVYGNGVEGDRNVFGDSPVNITGNNNFQNDINLFISDIADNGGPVPTCAIAAGSEAFDYATTSSIAQDAQGFYLNGARDAGAFEFNAITSFTPFITTWITSDGEITIPTIGGGYAYDITWTNITGTGGNGSETNVGSGDYTISGLNSGDTYRVEISGNFPRIYFNDGSNSPVPGSNSSKILTIEQWGDIAWESMGSAFQGCRELTYNASDNPDLSGVTDMSRMFDGATSFNGNIGGWQVGTITIMQSMFDGASAFNQDISGWTVTLVENFNRTFASADAFNQPLDAWDVSGAIDMTRMFAFTDLFDQPLDGWGTKLNGVTSMEGMFEGARVYDQDLNSWDVSTVLNFDRMFRSAAMFNGNMSSWTLTAADDMSQMFTGALAFNSDITGWNVSNVTNMSGMFTSTAAFNQDISGWDVSNVTDMGEAVSDPTEDGMFRNAVAFDQDLSTWDISSVTDMAEMFDGSGMSQENYDATLVGWSTLDGGETQIPTGITLGADGINYCDPTGRDALTNPPNNWVITDAGQQCPPPIAYYPFNGNANDESGNGNDGTWDNDEVYAADRFGNSSSTASFDGMDDFIDLGNPLALNILGDMSISAWILTNKVDRQHIISRAEEGETANENRNSFRLNATNILNYNYEIGSGVNVNVESSDRISTGEWSHVSFTRSVDATTAINVYVNGILQGTTSGLTNPDGGNSSGMRVQIGETNEAISTLFDGLIDDIRIYDRALFESEIIELYAENNWLPASPSSFITTWETTGTDESIELPLTDGAGFGQNYAYDFIIDWGDGTVERNTSTDLSHTYATPGIHTVAISGDFPFMSFNASGKNTSIDKLMSIEQWGDIEWESLSLAFFNCTNIVVNAADGPDLSNLTTTDMTFTFGNTAIVDGVGHWDVSTVTDMQFMFDQSPNFNEDLGGWDISNVNSMDFMLDGTGMSTDNYDATLIGWATLDAGESVIPSGVTLSATGLTYCTSETDRLSLISNGWGITGDSKVCIVSVSTFSPLSGAASTEVTISGANFDPTPANNIVYFGGAKAEVTAASSAELTVTVPVGAMYDHISVLTDGLIAHSPLKFTPSMPISTNLDANSFSPAVNISGVSGPRSLLFADIDLDGKLDMAAISQGDAEVALFRNISSSGNIDATSFESGITYSSGSNPVWLSAADLDRDGRLDLVSNHASGGSIGIYRNNASTGSFNAATLDARADISLNALSEELSIGDLNRDGQLDIVTTSNNNTLFQLFNNTTTVGALTTGSFDAPLDFTAGDDAISIAVGDLDGDGLVDVVTGNRGDVNITTMRNTTSGSYSFESPETRSAGNNPWGLELADIDGDGRLDVVASSQSDNQLYLYRNTSTVGDINLASPVTFSLPSGSFQLAIGDLSGDGKSEIVVASTGGGISVFQNQTISGTINSSSLGTRIDYPSNNGELLAIGDIDGDGANDIAVAAAAGTISLLRNTLLDGPIADYDFSGGSTTDKSGYGFDPAVNGSPQLAQDRFLVAGEVYSFDGTNDNMKATGFDLEPENLTMVSWFKFPEGADAGSNQLLDIEGVAALALSEDLMIGVINIDGAFVAPIHSIDLSPDQWYMAALTYNGGTADLYLNGVIVESFASAGDIDYSGIENAIIIGTNFDASANFEGDLDDLKIYGRALDASEILDLYNTGGWDVTNINEFSFAEQYQEAVVDTAANTVDIIVNFDADPASLTPTFRLSPQATARIASTVQTSGATANDYANPVTYEITSSDGLTVENWTVTVTVDNGLIVDMPFNGDATDISGKGNNGTLQGPTANVDRFGDVSSAYIFDGNDQINVPNNATLQLTDHITLSAWVKLNETSDDQSIIHKGEIGFIDYLLNVFGTNRPSPGVVEFGSQTFPQFVEGVTRVDDGREHHILGTYDGSALSIYVDGVLDNTQAASGNLFVGDGPLNIGAFATLPSTARFASGVIDDVQIFSRALDATEVRALYNERGWDITNINDFSLADQVQEADIDTAANTVNIFVNFGTDPSNLTPTFRLSTGATASISSTVQTSGTTENDYTNPITYEVTSEDGLTVENWTVTVTVDNGIVVDLPFTGNALDQSGKGNHGIVNGGAALTEDRFSVAGNAYLFDGLDDFIDVSGATSTEFSASFWFKANSITTENNSPDLQSIYYLYNEEGGNTAHSTTRLKASKIDVVQLRQESPNAFESYSEAFNDDVRWHHMVVTGSATQATTIYVDNQLQYTGDMGFTGWTDLVLGYSRFSGGTDYFDGAIDDVMVFSYVIDADQVDDLYRENGWPLLSEETDIIRFSVPDQTGDALIDTDLHTVGIEVEFGTDPTSLIATYELSDGATATISAIDQTSDISVNDFTNPLVYRVLAEDEFSSQSWLVTVTILPDMIAYYPFNSNTNDASGNGNDGTPNGGVQLTEDRFGNTDRAYNFDGVDDNIFTSSIELQDGFSTSIWFKTDPALSSSYALMMDISGYFGFVAVDQLTSRTLIRKDANPSNYEVVNGSSTVVDNAWHHGVATYNGSTFELYIDGVKENEALTTDFKEFSSYEIFIGSGNGGAYWNGPLDDIRIYGRALTQQEITDLYTEGGWPLTPDGTESILAREGVADIDADGVSYETLTVQVKDATGREIPTAGIEVQFSATEGTTDNDSDLFIDANGSVTDASGSITVQTDGTGLATVRLANSEIEQLSVIAQIDTDDDDAVDATVSGGVTPLLIDYVIGAPSVAATGSVISGSGPSTVADGSSAITVSVQLKDASGREVNQAGVGIQFTTTGSALLSGAAGSTTVMTNGLGQASVEVNNTVIETINVRALIDVNSINSFEDPLELITVGGTASGVVQIVFTADPTSAFITNVSILQVNKADGLDIELQSDETGTIYWIINLTGVFPDAAAIKSTSAATNGSGSFSISTADVLVQQTLAGTSLTDATRYQLYLVHEDENGNFSSVENLSWTADSAAPEISSATIDPATPTTVSLVFTEELVFDVVAGITLTDDDGAVVPFSSGATGPTLNFGLTLSSAVTNSDTLYVNYDAASGNFADIATNPLGSFVEKIPLNNGGVSDVTLDLALVQINQANGVTISHTSSATGKLKWLIQDNSTAPVLAAFDSDNLGGFGIDSITISSTSAVESIIQGTGLVNGTTYYLYAIAEDINSAASDLQFVSWVADGVVPTIMSAAVSTSDPTKLMITVSEEISAFSINGLTVLDAQGQSLSTSTFSLVSPTQIEVTLTRPVVESDVLTLSYMPTGNEIIDDATNNLEATTDLDVTNEVVTVPPVLTNVEITNVTGVESIDISYQVNKSGSIYWIAAPTGGSFTTAQIKAGTGNNSGFSNFEIGSIDELLSQTIAPLILANNEMFDIHLFAEDEAGVASAIEVRTWEADGKAPSMISAEVVNATPSQITLVFDEALVFDNLDGFSLEFIGSRLALSSVESLDDVTLILNLNGSLIQSDRVLLSYSPTNGSLRDSFDNIVRIIEDFEVDIDILDPPADLSNLEIVGINELVSIDLQYQSTKTGKMYWVMTNSAAIPTEIELKTGGSDNFGSGVFDIAVADETLIENLLAEGLEYLTAYYVHVAQEDDDGNLSEVSSLPWITPKGPPTIDPIAVLNIESLQVDLQYSSSSEESLVIHYAIYNTEQPNITTAAILNGLVTDGGDAIQFASFEANLNGEYLELIVFTNELSSLEHFIYAFGINENDVSSQIASATWLPVRESGTDPLIRNLITPNGDGDNDRLYIENLELYPGAHTVTLAERNGKPVITMNNFSNDNISVSDDFERLEPGAYICVLVLADGTKFMQSITILK